jgi:hypothetical protein
MDLLTALKILARQWPVVLAGLALTVVGVMQVGSMVAPQYEAKGNVLLLSPGANANPYLDFGPNLEVAADALMVVVQSPVGGEDLAAAGATGTYSLERVSGPLIDISASAGSADEASRTVDLVVTALQSELETAQATADPSQRITLNELTQPVPEAKLGSRIRAQAAVGALGLVLTVSAGLTVDALRRQRRERRERRAAQAGDTSPSPSPSGRRSPDSERGDRRNGAPTAPNGTSWPEPARPNVHAHPAAPTVRTRPGPAPAERTPDRAPTRPGVADPAWVRGRRGEELRRDDPRREDRRRDGAGSTRR